MLQKSHDDPRANVPSTLPEGIAVLQDPELNKGTAFTEAERDKATVSNLQQVQPPFCPGSTSIRLERGRPAWR
jgi:hypothetical protein